MRDQCIQCRSSRESPYPTECFTVPRGSATSSDRVNYHRSRNGNPDLRRCTSWPRQPPLAPPTPQAPLQGASVLIEKFVCITGNPNTSWPGLSRPSTRSPSVRRGWLSEMPGTSPGMTLQEWLVRRGQTPTPKSCELRKQDTRAFSELRESLELSIAWICDSRYRLVKEASLHDTTSFG